MTPEPCYVIQENAVLNALSQHIVATQKYCRKKEIVILVTFCHSAASVFLNVLLLA